MKTKLHKTVFLLAIACIGIQEIQAQNYFGLPFGGTATKIGNSVGIPDKVELEHWDETAGSPGGTNYLNTQANGVVGTYWDKTPGNSMDIPFRTGTDVDNGSVTDEFGTTRTVIYGLQGSEFLMYTVEVLKAGTYTVSLNYSHSSATVKRFQIAVSPIDNVETATTVFNYSPSGPGNTTNSSGAYVDSDESAEFTLSKGLILVRVRALDAGPYIDYISFKLKVSLSANDFDTNSIFISNPVNNELNIKGLTSKVKEVSIYSLLGKRVLQTNVDSKSSLKLDVSNLSSGLYVVKMTGDFGSFTKKIVKQ